MRSGNVVEEFEQRDGHAGHLDGTIAAECAGSPQEAGALACQDRQLSVEPTVEANHVAFADVEQLADGDGGRAQLDADRQPRAPDALGELDAVVMRIALARARREPRLRI